jgi:hypothetical protein
VDSSLVFALKVSYILIVIYSYGSTGCKTMVLHPLRNVFIASHQSKLKSSKFKRTMSGAKDLFNPAIALWELQFYLSIKNGCEFWICIDFGAVNKAKI